MEDRIIYMRYLLNGNYFVFWLRNHMICYLRKILNIINPSTRTLRKQYHNLAKCKKRIFLLGTEEFGNIGDMQINESINLFLKQILPDYVLHEVTAREWYIHKSFLKKYVTQYDLIVMAGGGNFGNIYTVAQELRTEIIQTWPDNPKIVFPQTIYFSSSIEGQKMLEKARSLYTNINRIILFTRERPSYIFAQNNFDCECYLVPDIVLTTKVQHTSSRENRILLCFRNDLEKDISEKTKLEIEHICYSSGMDVVHTDLQLEYNVDKSERKRVIEEKLNSWCHAKLVITDRLHGMIFAAITGTPCIAFGNYNHKINGTYEWIKYLPYIYFAQSMEDVENILPKQLSMNNCQYNMSPLRPYFDKLAEVIIKYVSN